MTFRAHADARAPLVDSKSIIRVLVLSNPCQVRQLLTHNGAGGQGLALVYHFTQLMHFCETLCQ